MPASNNMASLAAIEEQKARVVRMMAKAHSLSGRTGQELAIKWTRNICYYLYKRCREFAPAATLFAAGPNAGGNTIAVQHGWKIAELKRGIKIKSPWSKFRVQDIMRRRGNHRGYISTGWLNVKRIASKAGERLQSQALRNGKVIVDVQGGLFPKTTVRIINTSEYAQPFHEKHNIVALALADESADLAQYIALKTHRDVEEILRTT